MEITPTISSFLMHVKVEKGLSSNTVAAYKRDLLKFDAFAQKRKPRRSRSMLVGLGRRARPLLLVN